MVARLVGMPLLFAVVTEQSLTAGTFTLELRTAGATTGNHTVITIGGRTPPSVGVGYQNATNHKRFVLVHQMRVISKYSLYVVWVNLLRTCWTRDVDSRFEYFYSQILTHAVETGSVMTGAKLRKLRDSLLEQTDGTLEQALCIGTHHRGTRLGLRQCGQVGHCRVRLLRLIPGASPFRAYRSMVRIAGRG